jgi:hypothetical protein
VEASAHSHSHLSACVKSCTQFSSNVHGQVDVPIVQLEIIVGIFTLGRLGECVGGAGVDITPIAYLLLKRVVVSEYGGSQRFQDLLLEGADLGAGLSGEE